MEKLEPRTQVRSVQNEDDEPVKKQQVEGSYWQPGYIQRFPVLGFGSILLALICTAASVAVLVISNNKSTTQWTQKLAPNVVLSALNSVCNLALAYAFMTGASIAWWRKAMHGATVAELHDSWGRVSSVYEVLRSILRLDVIGIAALAAKIVVIDGILFQRATTTYVGQDPIKNITMMGVASTEFPQTGVVVSEGFGAQSNCECFMIGDEFTPIVNNWETSSGFFKGYNKLFQACDGTCFASIEAIGFEISCQKTQDRTNLAQSALAAYQRSGGNVNNSSAWSNLPIFNSSFTVSFANESRNYSTIDLALVYFQSEDPYNPSSTSCPGTVFSVNCALRPALVTYPVTITNYTNEHILNGVRLGTSSLDTDPDEVLNAPPDFLRYSYADKQAAGFSVGRYLYPSESQALNSSTRLGGIANALSQYLTSSAAISYTGDDTWALKQQGTLAQTMMYGPPNMGSCDCSFSGDALDSIVTAINQLTFVTATGSIDSQTWSFPAQALASKWSSVSANANPALTVNSSTVVTIRGIGQNLTTNFRELPGAREIRDVVHYQTDYLYVGLGIGVTLLCILLVLPVYWKYGELGRDVTLGPIEIAGAFRAPILSHAELQEANPPTTQTVHTVHTVPSSPASPTAISFANVDELIKEVGDRKVTYGFVDVDEPNNTTTAGGTLLSPSSTTHKRRSVLAFQDSAHPSVRPASGIFTSPPTSPRV